MEDKEKCVCECEIDERIVEKERKKLLMVMTELSWVGSTRGLR